MLTRPRASFSTIRASAPGLFRSRLANATSSTKRTRAFRSARLATTGLFTVMRIFPRPFTSAAERERMLTRASDSARLMPARTPGLDLSDRPSWVVLAIARLLLTRLSELHASRRCGNAARSREGSSPASQPPVPNIRRMPSDSPLQDRSARLRPRGQPTSRPGSHPSATGAPRAPGVAEADHDPDVRRVVHLADARPDEDQAARGDGERLHEVGRHHAGRDAMDVGEDVDRRRDDEHGRAGADHRRVSAYRRGTRAPRTPDRSSRASPGRGGPPPPAPPPNRSPPA